MHKLQDHPIRYSLRCRACVRSRRLRLLGFDVTLGNGAHGLGTAVLEAGYQLHFAINVRDSYD